MLLVVYDKFVEQNAGRKIITKIHHFLGAWFYILYTLYKYIYISNRKSVGVGYFQLMCDISSEFR